MRFPNPPITEAILDITVNPHENFQHESLLAFHEEIKESFPNTQKRMAFQGGIEFNLDNPDERNTQMLSISNKPEGYTFISLDKIK